MKKFHKSRLKAIRRVGQQGEWKTKITKISYYYSVLVIKHVLMVE